MVNGCRLFDDGLGGLTAYRDVAVVGTAFPKIVDQPDGQWFARKTGQSPAQLFDTRRKALNWLTKEGNR
jgi:hypothetical protein